MTQKTYHGSCHCGAVKYEADLDFEKGTGRCNCTYCFKTRSWGALLKPEQFRLIAGEGETSDYQFGMKVGHHRFCATCGIATHGEGHLEQLGGDFVSIQVSTLDDVTPEEYAAVAIQFQDGRHDNWWNEPKVKSYL
jgi:hypothetical protein